MLQSGHRGERSIEFVGEMPFVGPDDGDSAAKILMLDAREVQRDPRTRRDRIDIATMRLHRTNSGRDHHGRGHHPIADGE